jgi:hypothetical protein
MYYFLPVEVWDLITSLISYQDISTLVEVDFMFGELSEIRRIKNIFTNPTASTRVLCRMFEKFLNHCRFIGLSHNLGLAKVKDRVTFLNSYSISIAFGYGCTKIYNLEKSYYVEPERYFFFKKLYLESYNQFVTSRNILKDDACPSIIEEIKDFITKLVIKLFLNVFLVNEISAEGMLCIFDKALLPEQKFLIRKQLVPCFVNLFSRLSKVIYDYTDPVIFTKYLKVYRSMHDPLRIGQCKRRVNICHLRNFFQWHANHDYRVLVDSESEDIFFYTGLILPWTYSHLFNTVGL